MASTLLNITDVSIDKSNDIWITGRNIFKYDGSTFTEYDFNNSSVPSNSPYFLDTRSISVGPAGDKWVGCASAPYSSQIGVFQLIGEYAQDSNVWTFDEIGLTGNSWETERIYASPYGEEVVASISELNGGNGVTGSTGPFGVTGGHLFLYNKQFGSWREILTDFNWSRVYDIKTRGIDGKSYEYWVATDIGMIIFSGGDILSPDSLLDGYTHPKKTKFLNEYNSSFPSSTIYSIDFDYDGGVWVGTNGGLVYIDSDGEYTVWNTTNLPSLPSNSINIVKSVNNGQVFFSCGDGYAYSGTGLHYFNGDSLISYTTSNSNIPDNNITEIVSFWRKSDNTDTTYYPEEILLTCRNTITLFNYIVPHVYASAKNEGTAGWNFVYHTPSDMVYLPRVDKYTWEYPSWRTYQENYLEYKHPGLDRRNLFLTTDLRDIADGSAGKQDYWNYSEVGSYDSFLESIIIQEPSWISGMTGSYSLSTTSNIVTTKIGERYVVGITTDKDSVYLGQKADGVSVSVTNPNPTTGGATGSFGLLVYYNEFGQLEGYTPIRGNSTYIYDLKPSYDGKSLLILGGYDKNIEAGEFLWGGFPGGGASGGGPSGSAIGVTNISSGITGSTGDYSWILGDYTGATSGMYYPGWYTAGSGYFGMFVMELDSDLGITTSYGDINFNDQHDLKRKYFVKNFRHFPVTSDQANFSNAKLDVSKRRIRAFFDINDSNSLVYLYPDENDGVGVPDYIGDNKGTLARTTYYLSMDRDFNVFNSLYYYGSTGPGTVTITNSFGTERTTGTVLITGVSTGAHFYFNETLIGSEIDLTKTYSYYILLDSSDNVISYGAKEPIESNNASYITSTSGLNQHYIIQTGYGSTGDVFGAVSDDLENNYGAIIATVSPINEIEAIGTYQLASLLDYTDFNTIKAQASDDYVHVLFSGITGGTSANYLMRVDAEGGYPRTFEFFGDGLYSNTLDFYSDSKNNVFFAGVNNGGVTGPSQLPIDSTDEIFVGLSVSADIPTGKAKGDIISRAGNGAWRWADVNTDEKNMKVPLASTVFFVNNNSSIFGKNNYKWVLTDQKTSEELLNVKGTPYFIYTFTKAGYYTLYNSVEDSAGNVYEISKTSYIEVVNHKDKRADDPNPNVVDSFDYGYEKPSSTRTDKFTRFRKDLRRQQNEINKSNEKPFGSGTTIADNPDATFREDT